MVGWGQRGVGKILNKSKKNAMETLANITEMDKS